MKRATKEINKQFRIQMRSYWLGKDLNCVATLFGWTILWAVNDQWSLWGQNGFRMLQLRVRSVDHNLYAALIWPLTCLNLQIENNGICQQFLHFVRSSLIWGAMSLMKLSIRWATRYNKDNKQTWNIKHVTPDRTVNPRTVMFHSTGDWNFYIQTLCRRNCTNFYRKNLTESNIELQVLWYVFYRLSFWS